MDAAAAVSEPALDIVDLTVRYDDRTIALDRISLRVSPGEFVVLLGASGAGKSTLLRAVNGLVKANSGEVRVAGALVNSRNMREIRRRTSMVFQQFQLVPRLTVERNVLLGALARQARWRAVTGWFPDVDRRRAAELISQVGLHEEHLYRRASTLSGGQQQRVAIARAFMSRPRLLLADEPVASLDPALGAEIMGLLRDQARHAGTAVLCSLHQTRLAREFADRVVCIRDGALAADVRPKELVPELLSRVYGGNELAVGVAS